MWQKTNTKILGLLALLLVLGGLPLTLSLVQKQQNLEQNAATSTPVCSETGTDIVLIIDTSNSMNKQSSTTDTVSRFERAKRAAKNFAEILKEKNAELLIEKKHRLAIVSFSDTQNTILQSQLTDDMDIISKKIDAIAPGNDQNGWTCIECGLKKAIAELTSSRQRSDLSNIAILLTDGKANWVDGATTSVTQATAEQKAMDSVLSGYTIHNISTTTIGLGAKQDIHEAFLFNIASKTNGNYYYAPTATDLQGIYSQISQTLGKGVIAGFVYQDTNKNASFDTNENKLSGWKIDLFQNTTQQNSTVTDTNGNYTFENICDGSYQLKLGMQPGWEQTSPPNTNPIAVDLRNSDTLSDKSFGVQRQPLATTLVCSPRSLFNTTFPFEIQTILKDSQGNTLPNLPISAQIKTGAHFLRVDKSSSTTDASGIARFKVTMSEASKDTEGEVVFTFASQNGYQSSTCSTLAEYKQNRASLNISLLLDGLGAAGDNANPNNNAVSNKKPLHPQKEVRIRIYDENNKIVLDDTSKNTFSANGTTLGVNRDIGPSFPTGKYSIFISVPGYLTKRVAPITSITTQKNVDLPTLRLTTGDVNRDDSLNILDYDLMRGCYSDYLAPVSCSNDEKLRSDINDDGKVNQFDINLFLREMSVLHGDSIDPVE
ncbi:MAG: VWA domain-containing protein [Candidatus Levybacteria bacterium]|nr:VWA domain-containing protein [Candidatus Levybacteria bacterium]